MPVRQWKKIQEMSWGESVVLEWGEKDLDTLARRIADAATYLHIDEKRERLAELDKLSAAPDFWNDAQHAQELSKEAGNLRASLETYDATTDLLDEARTAYELAQDDESFSAEADEEYHRLEHMIERVEMESWFTGPFDAGDAILSINPGAGGNEAEDWVEMLYHMYMKYAERQGWKVQVLEYVEAEWMGLEKVTLQIEGHNAYGMLQSEVGVHRLVRISPTDLKARRHTTFAAVTVLPVLPDEIEVEIDPNDVRVDVFRAGGNGGQCVNTTDSAVRLTHYPTGIVVSCQNQKSQLLNKETAFKVLRSRIYALEEQKRQQEIAELRGEVRHIEFGSQIRNYVLHPYRLVKDTRDGIETGNVDAVLDGDIDRFVIGYHKWRTANRVAN